MAITSVPLTSAAQTHYGTTPNNVAAFLGTFSYNQISATSGQITITIQNTTNPSVRGYLVAMGIAIPVGSAVSSAKVLYTDCAYDVIVGTTDCGGATTQYGNVGIVLTPYGQTTWNCAGVIPHGPRVAIRPWQLATTTIAITGTTLGSLTATSWHSAVTDGVNQVFFPVHFRWLNGNDVQTNTTVGDDYVSSA